MEKIVLVSDSFLFLLSTYIFIEGQKGYDVISISLIAASIINAYLLTTKEIENRDFSIWISYTTNLYVLAIGLFLIIDNYGAYFNSYFPDHERRLTITGGVICIISILNLFLRYKLRDNKY